MEQEQHQAKSKPGSSWEGLAVQERFGAGMGNLTNMMDLCSLLA